MQEIIKQFANINTIITIVLNKENFFMAGRKEMYGMKTKEHQMNLMPLSR